MYTPRYPNIWVGLWELFTAEQSVIAFDTLIYIGEFFELLCNKKSFGLLMRSFARGTKAVQFSFFNARVCEAHFCSCGLNNVHVKHIKTKKMVSRETKTLKDLKTSSLFDIVY